jgi:hypothetical protein
MTAERPEIRVEGSQDGRTWQPYLFKYKADLPNVAPPIVGTTLNRQHTHTTHTHTHTQANTSIQRRTSHASTGRCGSQRWVRTNRRRGS